MPKVYIDIETHDEDNLPGYFSTSGRIKTPKKRGMSDWEAKQLKNLRKGNATHSNRVRPGKGVF